jgi:hypothetical protein
MTQELELLLKDLCGRLPYGVKGTNAHGMIVNLDHPTDYSPYMSIKNAVLKHDWKPYLFPLSSMTAEQKEEHKDLLDNQYSFDANGNVFTLQDFYCKYHFDYRCLISMGLAIDATGLNIY